MKSRIRRHFKPVFEKLNTMKVNSGVRNANEQVSFGTMFIVINDIIGMVESAVAAAERDMEVWGR